MTAQIQDTVEYKGITYLLIEYRGKSPFDPEIYGLEVTGKSSICWRGYACAYRIENQIIELDKIEASIGRYEGSKYVELELPRINTVEGKRQESTAQVFNAKYEQLHLQLPYSDNCTPIFLQAIAICPHLHPLSHLSHTSRSKLITTSNLHQTQPTSPHIRHPLQMTHLRSPSAFATVAHFKPVG